MVPVHIISKDEWAASSIFNPNAYPQPLKGLANSCILRAGILRYNVRNSGHLVQSDCNQLAEQLISLWDQQFKPVLEKNSKSDALVQLASLGCLTAIDSVLVSLKSLLDVFSTVISCSFVENQRLKFNRKAIDESDRQLSGGRLIKWLLESTSNQDKNKAIDVSEIITRHSKKWITDAVDLRDEIVHGGKMKLFKPVATTLRIFSDNQFNVKALSGPYINDGDVPSYCEGILKSTGDFVEEIIPFLPNVDMALINCGVYGKLSA